MFEKVGDGTWLTGMTRYEGFPLALRVRPSADSAANRAAFGHLGVITHQLARVQDNGLPEAKYNASLEDFDVAIQFAMKGEGAGLVVLIETFAGKRTYYAYVDDDDNFRERAAALGRLFEDHRLTVECAPDAAWRFYQRYQKAFPW